MTRKTALLILDGLEELYPDARAELDYSNAYELLVAVILSAQCTDVRVNKVTQILFQKAPHPKALFELPLDELEILIKPCGLYKSKAKHLQGMAQMILEKHDGLIPSTRDELKKLPGVGQKTANVVVSNVFDTPAIAVDTHVFRVSNRLGLAKASTVEATEKQLEKIIPKDRWTQSHHQLIFHGRRVCKARTPLCETCTLQSFCQYFKKNVMGKKSCKKKN